MGAFRRLAVERAAHAPQANHCQSTFSIKKVLVRIVKELNVFRSKWDQRGSNPHRPG